MARVGLGYRLLVAALLAVCAVGLAQGSCSVLSGDAARAPAALALRARGDAAGAWSVVLQGSALRRYSHQLFLRGAGDDDEEEAADDEEKEEAEEGDAGEAEEDDPDAGPMTITKAIRQVLYHARTHNGVAKGIKEVCQSLERGEAQLVILAEDCDHEEYVKLVTALTAEKGVYLIKVPEKAKLGDWAGQHKLDADANVKKTCSSSCVAVKDFGEQSEGLGFLLQYIKAQQGDDEEPAAIEEAEEAAEEEMEEGVAEGE